ncbi:restriction endonuclease subunit S [Pantoea sp. Fr+CA_20]|uniref:restriction endonuclease subunit S n=1 Tax=Pantoea sp. Fr+CA_20 TaxID=2929506 RepID=UPI0021197996|nr:restriction endonuclease subunit S [Pantoea sp. Fr+CA_20]
MRSNYKRIGDYVTLLKLKNTDGFISLLKGININKHFMPSVANINGTDLSTYQVVNKNQFAFNPMHVGRDEVLPISMLEDDELIIVSPAYVVFEVKDEEELLPEYLMMWCRRSEFDRNAWFMTDNSVRGGFSWADFCDMEMPIPSIEKQREIVREYKVVSEIIILNEQIIQKLECATHAIYKQWFVDFEFPISKEYSKSIGKPELEGKPYKSCGGQMIDCDELDIKIPKEWRTVELGTLADIKVGGDRPNLVSDSVSDDYSIPIYANSTENEGLYGYTDKAKILDKSITVSARGAIIGYTVLRLEPFFPIVRLIVVTPENQKLLNYLFESIKQFRFDSAASAQGQLTAPDMKGRRILLPSLYVSNIYQEITASVIKKIMIKKEQNKALIKLLKILQQRMSME